jgi:hypothetical protein
MRAIFRIGGHAAHRGSSCAAGGRLAAPGPVGWSAGGDRAGAPRRAVSAMRASHQAVRHGMIV